jgi:glucosamine--fructose-6-phosphate aminotransferase (isomerizing)
MVNAQRMIILGCGTSWHAAMIAEYLFEDLGPPARGSGIRFRIPLPQPGRA